MDTVLFQLLVGGATSLINFGIHAVVTGLIVVLTRHIAGATDDLHVFARVSALMMVTIHRMGEGEFMVSKRVYRSDVDNNPNLSDGELAKSN